MNLGNDKRLASMILGGCGMMLVGIFLTGAMIVGARFVASGPGFILALGPLLFAAGLILLGYTVLSGLSFTRKLRNTNPTPIDGVRVQARYAMNTLGEMLFNEQDFDMPGTRFYVRVQYPNGRTSELECDYKVFSYCGEGMWGSVVVQGDWLGQFTPAVVRT